MNASNTPRKQGLRMALRAHPRWPSFRSENGVDLGTMTMADLEAAHVTLYGAPFKDGAEGAPIEIEPEGDDAPEADAEGDDAEGDDAALEQVAKLLSDMRRKRASALTEAKVVELIGKHAARPAAVNLTVNGAVSFKADGQLMHYAFPALLAAVSAGVNVMLVGPAGSGKTTAAEQVAKVLNRPFDFTGALASEYKLTGFIDAQGRIVSTAFRRAYENGGIFLFDEMDASLPAPCLAFNAALANGHADFPDQSIKRHADFAAIAACNTFGRGADRQYVGRNQLDAATLDRWAVLEWNYDSGLESALVGLNRPSDAPAPIRIKPVSDDAEKRAIVESWTAKVRAVRRKTEEQKIRHVVSPRATVNGAKLLIAGWSEKLVEDGVLYKGADVDTRAKIAA